KVDVVGETVYVYTDKEDVVIDTRLQEIKRTPRESVQVDEREVSIPKDLLFLLLTPERITDFKEEGVKVFRVPSPITDEETLKLLNEAGIKVKVVSNTADLTSDAASEKEKYDRGASGEREMIRIKCYRDEVEKEEWEEILGLVELRDRNKQKDVGSAKVIFSIEKEQEMVEFWLDKEYATSESNPDNWSAYIYTRLRDILGGKEISRNGRDNRILGFIDPAAVIEDVKNRVKLDNKARTADGRDVAVYENNRGSNALGYKSGNEIDVDRVTIKWFVSNVFLPALVNNGIPNLYSTHLKLDADQQKVFDYFRTKLGAFIRLLFPDLNQWPDYVGVGSLLCDEVQNLLIDHELDHFKPGDDKEFEARKNEFFGRRSILSQKIALIADIYLLATVSKDNMDFMKKAFNAVARLFSDLSGSNFSDGIDFSSEESVDEFFKGVFEICKKLGMDIEEDPYGLGSLSYNPD
ncbi:MAG: hypothetical protein JSV34_07025, partial [Candidatus Omnitrophota bacterium]